jgi:hypothetical protein
MMDILISTVLQIPIGAFALLMTGAFAAGLWLGTIGRTQSEGVKR